MEKTAQRQEWIDQICAERDRQDEKWGTPQDNTFCEWGSILSEECGELCKELNDLNFGKGDSTRMVTEAVQVAAVALSILEQSNHAHMVTAAWRYYKHATPTADGTIATSEEGKDL